MIMNGITAKDERYYNLACKVALLSECHYRHGSVLVKGNTPISVACNRLVTHPNHKRFYDKQEHVISAHAEMRVVALSRSNVEGSTCYNARIKGRELEAISKPCAGCVSLLLDAGVGYIVYYTGTMLVKKRLG